MAMRFHVAEYGARQCEHRTACLNLQRRVSNNTRAEPTEAEDRMSLLSVFARAAAATFYA